MSIEDSTGLAQQLYLIDRHDNVHAHWSLNDFENELSSENSRKIFLYNSNQNIHAFILYRIILNEAWIMNLAVMEKRKGWAKKILLKLEEKLVAECPGINEIWLEVREENIPAIELYKNFGFSKISERKGYYDQGRSSAWVMKKCL